MVSADITFGTAKIPKMSNYYNELVEGLNEAIAFAGGKDTGARVHVIEVPVIDVAKIRAQTGDDYVPDVGGGEVA
jgi:hypothetical protein